AITFAFQGGEPTLMGACFYREWLRLVKKHNARRLPVHYALQTNGVAVDDALMDVLADGNFLVGVSLDGTKDIHDSRRKTARGEGSYDRALHTIRRLHRRQIAYNILCVVDEAVAKAPDAVYDALRAHGYIQFIPCLDPIGADTRQLRPKSYGQFLIAVFDRYERDIRTGHYVSVNVFDNWVRILRGQPPTACNMTGHCSPNYVAESNGNIYPCDFYCLDEWLLGNITESSLYTIAKAERLHAFLTESRAHPGSCISCPFYTLCRTGCKRDHVRGLNRLCEGFKLFFEQRAPALMELAKVDIQTEPVQSP
ncbi:MAG: SPASM domain-containing protein, partial [Clostridiales bacterium]|nr:SPASM domain-containing protein [Clostridiales bacterium]